MKWFRLYSEFFHDPKMKLFSIPQRYAILALMATASESRQRGIIFLDDEDLAASLDLEDKVFASLIEKMIRKQIVQRNGNGYIEFLNWNARQYDKPSDYPENVKERVRNYRERKAAEDPVVTAISEQAVETPKQTKPPRYAENGNAPVTQDNAPVTRSNTDETLCNTPVTPHRITDKKREDKTREENIRADIPPSYPPPKAESQGRKPYRDRLTPEGLSVCEQIQSFFPKAEEEAICHQIHVFGPPDCYWQMEAVKWRIDQGRDIGDPFAYWLRALDPKTGPPLPLPAAVQEMKLRRDEQEAEMAAQAKRQAADAEKAAEQSIRDEAERKWQSLDSQEQERIEQEVGERFCTEFPVHAAAWKKGTLNTGQTAMARRLRDEVVMGTYHQDSPARDHSCRDSAGFTSVGSSVGGALKGQK